MEKRTLGPLLLALAIWVLGAALGVHLTPNKDGITYDTPHGFAELAQKALFDLAIAIAIAVAVRELIDRAREQRSSIEILREALGAFFSRDLIQEAMDAIFARRLVRSWLDIEYIFWPNPKTRSIIYLDTLAEYEVENVSDITEDFPIGLMLPNLMAKFKDDPLREKPQVLSVKIGDKIYSDAELKTINDNISIDDPNPEISFEVVRLRPKQSIVVRTESRSLKLSNDVETVRMRLATKRVTIKVMDGLDGRHNFEIESIHNKKFPPKDTPTADKRRWTWKGPSFFLPQNGWVLYWNDLSRNPSTL